MCTCQQVPSHTCKEGLIAQEGASIMAAALVRGTISRVLQGDVLHWRRS